MVTIKKLKNVLALIFIGTTIFAVQQHDKELLANQIFFSLLIIGLGSVGVFIITQPLSLLKAIALPKNEKSKKYLNENQEKIGYALVDLSSVVLVMALLGVAMAAITCYLKIGVLNDRFYTVSYGCLVVGSGIAYLMMHFGSKKIKEQ